MLLIKNGTSRYRKSLSNFDPKNAIIENHHLLYSSNIFPKWLFSLLPLVKKDDSFGYYLALRVMTLGFLILSRKQVKSDMERVNRTIPGILSGRQGGFAAPLGALLLFQEILFYLIACERPPRQGSKFSEFVSDQIVTHHKKSTSKEKSHEWPNFSFLHGSRLHLGLRYFTTHWGTHFENTREIWSSNKIFRTFDWNLISAKQSKTFFSQMFIHFENLY